MSKPIKKKPQKPHLSLNLGESFEKKNDPNDKNPKNKYMLQVDSNYSILNGSQSIEL
jgi:hypothetical protein